MKVIFSILFFLVGSIIFGQTQILKKYDFDKGGYYLLGVYSGSDPNGLQDSLGEFYTNDIPILNEFKKEWVFKKPSPKYACGYHYEVLICKEGRALESIEINLNCNEIVSDLGYFYFDSNKLRRFYGRLKKAYSKMETFGSIEEARNRRINILKENTLIMVDEPRWVKYEGKFKFTYPCNSKTKLCVSEGEKIIPKLTEEIKCKYPNEDFVLSDVGGSRTEIFIEVMCNKTLSEKFNLYKRDLKYDQWEPFEFRLGSFWIKPK